MSNETIGKLEKNISQRQILEFIKDNFDENAFANSGYVEFTYKGEKRSLFFLNDSKMVYISLGFWGESVEIIASIVKNFGGWVDENCCDDEDFYYIPKDKDSKEYNIIYITQEELNKKFGGIVVIK